MDQETRNAVELYFEALKTANVSNIPLADDVVFVGPMFPEGVRGESDVRELLSDVAAGFSTFVALRILVDGEYACAPFEFTVNETGAPRVCGVDYFRVVNGQLVEIRPYFDPRPLLGD